MKKILTIALFFLALAVKAQDTTPYTEQQVRDSIDGPANFSWRHIEGGILGAFKATTDSTTMLLDSLLQHRTELNTLGVQLSDSTTMLLDSLLQHRTELNALGTLATKDQVGTADIETGAVTATKIASDAVSSDEIVDGSILPADLDRTYLVPGDTSSISSRIDAKQATLVSGTNIKTVNGNSLLGSGNIAIAGGGGSTDTLFYTPEMFGAVGDGVTKDTEAIRSAIARSAATGKMCVIDGYYYHEMTTADDVIQIPGGAHVEFTAGGKVRVNQAGVPAFMIYNDTTIIVRGMEIAYDGFTDKTVGKTVLYDANYEAWRADYTFSGGFAQGNNFTIIAIAGGKDVLIEDANFYAVDTTTNDNQNYMMNGIVVFGIDDNNVEDVTIRNFRIDGAHMPILAYRVTRLTIDGMQSYRYGAFDQTDPAVNYAEPPPHLIYVSSNGVTSQQPNKDVIIRNVYDYGDDRSEGDNGQSSLKLLSTDGFVISNVTSFRPHGLMDFASKNGTVSDIKWKGNDAKTTGGTNSVYPIRLLPASATGIENVMFSDMDLELDDEVDDVIVGSQSEIADNITMRNVKISGPFMQGGPIIRGAFSNSFFDITMNTKDDVGGNVLFRIDMGYNNDINLTVNSVYGTTGRVLSLNDADTDNNNVVVRYPRQGITQHRRHYTVMEEGMKIDTVDLVAGGQINVSQFIEKGMVLRGVYTEVLEAIGTTNGTTGYEVGSGLDFDWFGVNSSTSAGSDTDNGDWTTVTWPFFQSNENLKLTPVGGNFDGTGKVLVVIHYTMQGSTGDIN